MIRINLLPKQPRRRLPETGVLQYAVPLVVLLVVAVWSLVLINQRNGLQANLTQVEKDIETERPKVQQVIELDRQIAIMRTKEKLVSDLLKQQLPAASILNEVRLLIPRDVWTIALNVPEPSSLNMEGMAVNYYAVARLMDNLTAGQLFKSVDLTVAQMEKIGTVDVVRFQITARILKTQAVSGGGQQ